MSETYKPQEAKHSPLPWRTFRLNNRRSRAITIVHGDGLFVSKCGTHPLGEADAALIVTAVNSYNTLLRDRSELLSVLDEIVHYRGGADNALSDLYVMERACALLSKVTP